jgi:hypothetical protein
MTSAMIIEYLCPLYRICRRSDYGVLQRAVVGHQQRALHLEEAVIKYRAALVWRAPRGSSNMLLIRAYFTGGAALGQPPILTV